MNRTRLFLFLLIASASGLQASWRQRLGLQRQPQQQFYGPMTQQQWQQPTGPRQPVQWAQPASPSYQQQQPPRSQEWAQEPEARRDDDRRDDLWQKEDERRASRHTDDVEEDAPEQGALPSEDDPRFAGLNEEQVAEATATSERVSGADPLFSPFLKNTIKTRGIGRMILHSLLGPKESDGVKLQLKLKVKRHKNVIKWYADRWLNITKYASSRGDDLVAAAQFSRMIRLVVNAAAAYLEGEDNDGYAKASQKVADLPVKPDFSFIVESNKENIDDLADKELARYDRTKISREAKQAIYELLIQHSKKEEIKRAFEKMAFQDASEEKFEKLWANLSRGRIALLRPLISLILLFDEQFKDWQLNRFSHAARAEEEAEEDEESSDKGALAHARRRD